MNDSTQYPANSFSLLLIGDSGTRKTSTAMQFPDPYILDLDCNLGGVTRWITAQNASGTQGWWTDKKFYWDTIPANIEPKSAFKAAVDYLKVAAKDDRVKTLVIDSVTRMNELCVDQLKQTAIPGSNSTDQMTEQKWGALGDKLIELLMVLKTCGKPVIVIAHETWDKDEVTGITRCYPSVQGRLRQTMARLFSDYWRSVVEGEGANAKYWLTTAPAARVNCKCSLPGLPAKFEMDFNKIAPFFPKPTPEVKP